MTRSLRADVRNPVLALPATKALRALPLATREALAAVLAELTTDARERAEKCWRTHKGPMALYWKCVAVYAGHIRRALLASAEPGAPTVPKDWLELKAHPVITMEHVATRDGWAWWRTTDHSGRMFVQHGSRWWAVGDPPPLPIQRCTCPSYYATEDAALADFCPVHGLEEFGGPA